MEGCKLSGGNLIRLAVLVVVACVRIEEASPIVSETGAMVSRNNDLFTNLFTVQFLFCKKICDFFFGFCIKL